MKICRVTQAIYPYVIGGSPTHCHELSNNQSTDHSSVLVLTVRRNNQIDSPTVNYDLKQFGWMRMPWDVAGMENPITPGLWWHLLRTDYDVLHAHSHLFFTSALALITNKMKGKPSVLTIHGVRAVRQSSVNLFQELWMQLVARYLFKLTDRIICLTPADAHEISHYGVPPEKIQLIPNGIDTTLFHPQDTHDGYLLWVGRFVEEKGLRYLVDAIQQLTPTNPNLRVVLVGDGPLRPHIINQIHTKGLDQHFELHRNCSQREIAALMRNCTAFVLPSLQEGFPKSLLEAMACARPVITTSSLTDIVGDAGITIPPKSVEALSQAILTVLTNPATQHTAGLQGRHYVETKWSWPIVTDQTNRLYQTIVQGAHHDDL